MHWPGLVVVAQSGNPLIVAIPWILIAFAAYFMLIRPQQRKDQQHRALLEALKKDDRVVTIGGIYGVVTNVRREADRITLKVDEANNTKIDVTFGSVARVVTDEPNAEKASK